MIASMLMAVSAGIVLMLGLAHLLYTFYGPKLLPRDAALIEHMKNVHPVITRETTIWKCWIGFNASHSMAAILFGLIYGYFAMSQSTLLFGSPYLLGVGLAMLSGFFVLGWRYWFSVPFTGISLSLACYLGALILSVT